MSLEQRRKKEKLKLVLEEDLSMYNGNRFLFKFMKTFILHPNFRAIAIMRFYQASNAKIIKALLRLYKHHLENKYCLDIPLQLRVGKGLLTSHRGSIIINPHAILGEHVIIYPNVLIGGMRGKGFPTIGNRVFIGEGTKIIGNIHIGNDVFIQPNSLVIKDIEDGVTVGGNPAIILNHKGKSYVDLYSK